MATDEAAAAASERYGIELTYKQVQSYWKRVGLKVQVRKWQRGTITREMAKYIDENYEGTGPKEMARLLSIKYGVDVTRETCKSYYNSKGYDSGLTGRFYKGQPCTNRLEKGKYYPGCEKTWFKKGNVPHNLKADGAERIDEGGRVLIRVSDAPGRNNYVLKNRLEWEKERGPIPEGMMLRCLDGNLLNTSPDNYELVSKRESLEITRTYGKAKDKEITRAEILTVRLNNIINEKV